MRFNRLVLIPAALAPLFLAACADDPDPVIVNPPPAAAAPATVVTPPATVVTPSPTYVAPAPGTSSTTTTVIERR
jgi:hypothetical protein